ncbi:MAG: DNA topoisomerase IV subunit A [Proteobacteria bacterium]|nr:DNA topoisomerase IV subunit A [Pseudomonadota bacterium]
MAQLEALMERHFIDYASYFILDRAIPDLRDGLKPVQRRLLHTLFEKNDGRYHKVANVIGDTMKLHPHGDAAIGDALVVLANKELFIDRQGNFGNLITGHPAAAPRYIECRLTPLALETLFNEALTEFVPSYDGRNREPVALPAKLPVVLMLGIEGIAVGMATRILPHNLRELWEAQMALLEGKRTTLLPDFLQGGLMDASAYDDGRGKVDVRARIEVRDSKHVVIREIPYGTTTESLIASIEAAAQKGRVKIASIDDFTTDHVEIELTLARGANADEVIPQLLAYTDCNLSVSSNLVVIVDRRPVEMTVSEVLVALTEQLKEQIRAELQHERGQLIDRQHWLTLEQIFVEKRIYKKIETAKTSESVRAAVLKGMVVHEALFVRPMVDDDVTRLLDLRIRRISAYDVEKNRSELGEMAKRIRAVDRELKQLTRTTIRYVKGLLERYGEALPRRTEVARFQSVDRKAVAAPSINLAYDRASGFFGSSVRGDEFKLTVSEYDLVLGVADDGTYRVMTPSEKHLFSGRLLYCAPFDPESGAEFTVVYRDKARTAYAKRIRIEKFIRNREYTLIKDRAGRIDLLLPEGETGRVKLVFAPAKRQRKSDSVFDLSTLEPTGVAARGTRLASKPVRRVKLLPAKSPRSPRKKAPRRSVPPRGGQGSLF